MTELRFDGKIVAVTHASSLLGQEICLELLKKGAHIIALASSPVDFPCKRLSTISEYKAYLKSIPRLDILINCNISPCESSLLMTSWEQLNTGLSNIFSVISPAWKLMRKHKFGRIVNISSLTSFYSTANTSNYSTTTYSLQGLSNTLIREGAKFHIKVNTLVHAPFDEGTFTPSNVVPVACYLAHESCEEKGGIIEASGGYIGKIRLQRGGGWIFTDKYTAEDVQDKIKEISTFGKNCDYPVAFSESLLKVMYVNLMGKPKI